MNMENHNHILGIDAGSVAVAVAALSVDKRIVQTAYGFHHGNIQQTLDSLLADFNLSRIRWVAATTSSPPSLKATCQYDNRIAIISAARRLHERVGSILIVGGEKFGLIRFDENGNYKGYKANTSCAAGTGSFLDQQAERLGLEGIGELGRLAFTNTGSVPKIASRCAVFAKTDPGACPTGRLWLTEICDGLCFGLARNIVDTLFVGQACPAHNFFGRRVQKQGGCPTYPGAYRHGNHSGSLHYGALGAAFNLIDEGLAQPEQDSSRVRTWWRRKRTANLTILTPWN
jgi:activator of 2-hydroxyglutaryl-CoA dehydratase